MPYRLAIALCVILFLAFHDDAKPAHGRSGKITDAVIKDRCSGSCDRDDDVDRTPFYPDPHRGDRQDHEGTDGERC